MSLRVAIVSGILHPSFGGPAAVVASHALALTGRVSLEIFGVAGPGEERDIQALLPNAQLFPRSFPSRWFRGTGLAAALSAAASRVDLFHAHMLWDFPVYAAWRAARVAGKPLIITPHGSISEPWRYSAPHKRLYRTLILDRVLRDTRFIHALNAAEARAVEGYGAPCPIRVIGNGLSLDAFDVPHEEAEAALSEWPMLRNRKVLLFVGRLGPEKGLDLLIPAWANAIRSGHAKGWHLVLAGPDYRGYRAQVEDLVRSLGLQDSVLLVGYVGRTLRRALLALTTACVLPSRSEGLSMSLLEGAAAGRPALLTTTCNFPELARAGGGVEVAPQVEDISHGLTTVLNLPPEQLSRMGCAAQRFVREHYSMEQVADQIVAMYEDAVKGPRRSSD
jgi:glycosyltransferase involved in cell wall biosynthesis